MKKLLCWAIVICMVLSMMPVTAHAASGSCGENVSWSLNKKVLTISGTGPTYEYGGTENTPWYSERANIRSVVVEPGVTRIGEKLLGYLSTCTSVTLADSVTEIGPYAFLMCTALTDVKLGKGLEVIGADAFTSCKALPKLELPESLHTLGDRAFSTSGLQSVTIPAGVTERLSGSLRAVEVWPRYSSMTASRRWGPDASAIARR